MTDPAAPEDALPPPPGTFAPPETPLLDAIVEAERCPECRAPYVPRAATCATCEEPLVCPNAHANAGPGQETRRLPKPAAAVELKARVLGVMPCPACEAPAKVSVGHPVKELEGFFVVCPAGHEHEISEDAARARFQKPG